MIHAYRPACHMHCRTWRLPDSNLAYPHALDYIQVRELQANAVPPAAAAAAVTAAAAAATADSGNTSSTPTAGASASIGVARVSAFATGGMVSTATLPGEGPRSVDRPKASLNGRAFLRLGIWQWAMNDVRAGVVCSFVSTDEICWGFCVCVCVGGLTDCGHKYHGWRREGLVACWVMAPP